MHMQLGRFLIVATGGALGSMARYWVGGWAPRVFGQAFPYGTFIVNVLGSFLISGIMTVGLNTTAISPNMRLFLSVGVLGGFTTYSSFNYETLTLLQQRLWLTGGLNMAATGLGCLVAGALGLALAQMATGS
jgi:CrcB protein